MFNLICKLLGYQLVDISDSPFVPTIINGMNVLCVNKNMAICEKARL